MIEQLGEFWRSQTSRLALVYLAIIMTMSLGFSVSIYMISAEQLERQLPDDSWVSGSGEARYSPIIGNIITQSVHDAKQELIVRLYVLNLVVLLFGGALSVLLARWTLEPIERSVAAQARFVSDASHELRTPLTAIQTANEVALRRKKLTLKEAKATLQANLDDVERLQRLTTMLLEIAADEMPLHIEPVLVSSLVERAVQHSRPTARAKSITLKQSINRSLLVQADADAAIQALTVLIDNAIKYSPKQATVAISAIKRRSNIVIRVRDRGPGIDKREQKLIFDRFYRTDQARSRTGVTGYGLGLEIAQSIARHHNGSIELRSAPGKGSTFSLVLPIAK